MDILEKVSSGEIPRIYYDVLEIATQKMKDRYEDGYELKIREMWEKFIRAAQAKTAKDTKSRSLGCCP